VVCCSLFIVVIVVIKPLQLVLEAREGESSSLLPRKDNPLQLTVDVREEELASSSSLPRTRK
jgi:hypothetical protein